MPVKHLAKSVTKASKAITVNSVKEHSWESLQAIEKRRRAILRRQGRYSFFRIVLFWDGTLLKLLAKDRLMWVTMGIYVVIRFLAHLDTLPDVLNDIAGADIGVIGVFLSFFLVLFVNDSNTSLEVIYGLSMKCEHRILDVASLARTTLPRERGLRLVRYMNAAHAAAYVGLSRIYTFRNFFSEVNQLNRFLTSREVKRMEEIDMNTGGSTYRELLVWCLLEVKSASDEGIINPFLSSKYRELILQLRGTIAALYDDDDQPISFAYYHFMCFLSAVYLPLFSMSAALDAGVGTDAYWLTDMLSGFIVMLQAIFVVGLRVLAEVMSDPYGDDVDNLSVLHYINYTWKMSSRIMMASDPGPLDINVEEKLYAEKNHIGDPWKNRVSLSSDGFSASGSSTRNSFDDEGQESHLLTKGVWRPAPKGTLEVTTEDFY